MIIKKNEDTTEKQRMMMECKCKDWKQNVSIINSSLCLAYGHGFGEIKKVFAYCPYCGKKLQQGGEK